MARSFFPPETEQVVRIDVGTVTIDGTLAIPDLAHGVVLFAHGSGSRRDRGENRPLTMCFAV